MATVKPQSKSEASNIVELLPDAAILIEARIKAGEPGLKIRDLSNLILHDPVLSLEFLQYANSAMFAGAQITNVEAALTRLGTEKLVSTLAALNVKHRESDEDVLDMFEILRYNCRRASIISMIITTALRPQLAQLARTVGLFADVGHMEALLRLGKKYCEIAKEHRRKNLPYRLLKEHKLDVNTLRAKHLRQRGLPTKILLVFDEEIEVQSGSDADLRLCVASALELIDAYDSGKLANYAPDKGLPTHSNLRLMRVGAIHQEKIYHACSQYLKQIAEEEAPEGASFFITSVDEDDDAGGDDDALAKMDIPTYPNTVVKPRNRERLQDFFELCETEEREFELKERAVQQLKAAGLFERAALVRVSPSANAAVIEHSAGLDKKPGDEVEITDPLSPFNMFRLEIKSCNTKAIAPSAPFGVSAYAIGPVELRSAGERLLLYADNAGIQSLSMESRRVFRMVLGLLARTVQTLAAKRDGAPTASQEAATKNPA